MISPIRTQISQLVAAIGSLETRLKPLAEHYAKKARTFSADRALYSQEYWNAESTYRALTRVRNFIENNFMVIETFGVLSLARYTFELVVQLKRIDLDPVFAIVYAREMIEQQVEHHKKMAEHLKSEIDLYRQLAVRESADHQEILAAATGGAKPGAKEDLGREIAAAMNAASSVVDDELAVALTLYSEDAKINGFAIQAHLLETQALPQFLTAVTQNEESLAEFDKVWSKVLAQPKYVVNKWNKRAEQVGMKAEYDFIYNYTSRLLHATPVSISTDQQCLQDGEILVFFKYVRAEFLWVIRRAENSKLPILH